MSAKKLCGNTTKILNCYLQDKFILQYMRLNIFKWKTNFSFHKHYLFGLHFSKSAKKPHTDQSILATFLLCLKRDVSQNVNSSSYKQVFPKCVYHGYSLLRWFFFIPCDSWTRSFFMQTYHYSEVWWDHHVAAFFKAGVLKDVRISVFISIISTITLQCCYYHKGPK